MDSKLDEKREIESLASVSSSVSQISSEEQFLSTIEELLALNKQFDSIIKWTDFNRKRKQFDANSSKLLIQVFL